MNGDFHFFGTGTAALAAGLSVEEATIVANAAEFVDYFIGDYYWSYWQIVADESWQPKVLFKIKYPQLTAQSTIACSIDYYPDYWLAFHFPPGNKQPVAKPYSGAMADLQKRYLKKFELRYVNSRVKNATQLCRPYSQFAIDMIYDTLIKYQAIKTDPNWKDIVKKSISSDRYISDKIDRNKLALIFLGIRMHVLADTWAHQDFTGFYDININYIDGDVLADVNTPRKMEKAPFSFLPAFVVEDYFTGENTFSEFFNIDTDIIFAPKSGCGHGNMGHYPDYGWLNIEYPAAWRICSNNIKRDNPGQFKEAWNEMASVIAMCLNNQSTIPMPADVEQDITKRFKLSSTKVSAPIECEKNWASNSGKPLKGVTRWKDKIKDPYIGVTHGLPISRWGNLWIKDGSILHMYELAALMHFSWCQSWTRSHPEYGWMCTTIKEKPKAQYVLGMELNNNYPHILDKDKED
ncbi:DUF6765 family protein [Acetivibrio clariflavus]|uniref:Uncharacterized protein n=1 Tax=Acetivibrio clariflavus (strain DSM 19732 / NBRC 101661 / EBR45) TaxID=720554 RepID=G8LV30_ACECE|nr:DUF6765 family protein [Acetivibrio clariflavus]AEV69607.1 hypothetical protein Clocl_3078 [Acetivibrio clariflavus DSM 19732]